MKFSDLVIAFPTIPDHKAFRDSRSGSWFIQAINKVFGNKELVQSLEIRDLLDKVAVELATRVPVDYECPNTNKIIRNVVQSSEYTVTGMRKHWYFPEIE